MKENKERLPRALSVSDMVKKTYSVFDFTDLWNEFIGTPERTGVWFIYGRSGNGKTSFVMQLAKELSKHGKVLYNSLEEGESKTLQNAIHTAQLPIKGSRIRFVHEDKETLSKRLSRKGAADFVIIDSLKYFSFRNFDQYKQYVRRHRNKLLIFTYPVPKAGMKPLVEDVLADASLKVWIEGYKAISKGRYIGDTGEYTIWQEGANRIYGTAHGAPLSHGAGFDSQGSTEKLISTKNI